MKIRRREFLGAAAGAAVLTGPGFLSGCGAQRELAVAAPSPGNPFLDDFGIDQSGVLRVLAALTANGADIADLYLQRLRSNEFAHKDGIVVTANSTIEQGVGMHVVNDGQTGYAFTEDLDLTSLLAAARSAAGATAGGAIAVPQGLQPQPAGDRYANFLPWSDIGMDRKLPLVRRVEEIARSLDPAVENVAVFMADSDEHVTIVTLDGRLVNDHRPMTRITVVVTARRGEELRSGFANRAARAGIAWFTDERLNAVAAEAVERALQQFEAQRLSPGEFPVVLAAGTSGVLLHEAIGHAFEADLNRDGVSPYADSIGAQIAPPFVTIVDDASIPYERGALNYDDEGNEAGRTVLVEQGMLRSYLHDATTARHYKVQPTGSGRRQGYRFPPAPRMSCTFMESGPHTKEEIIAAVDYGIIAETYTGGQVQLGVGDFTFQIKNGWLIENGRITAPLRDFSITGNGPELLRRISMVADDARLDSGGWTCGKNGQNVPVSEGMPTVLVPAMQVQNL